MFARSKTLLVGFVVAAGAAGAAPAAAGTGAALSPCAGRSLFGISEWHQTVALAGAYTSAGAIDVDLTCGVVRQGETVARVSEDAPGPVAAVAGIVEVHAGTIGYCYELRVTYVDRTTYSDNCP